MHPLVESGDFDLLVHHKLGGEPPALVKRRASACCSPAIDVPEATLHGSGMHPCRFDAFGNVEREIMLTCRDAFGNRVPRVGLTIGTELAAKLTSVDAEGAAIEGAAAPTVVITDVGGGVYRLTYGVRVRGSFELTVRLLGETLISRSVDVLGGDEPDEAIIEGEIPSEQMKRLKKVHGEIFSLAKTRRPSASSERPGRRRRRGAPRRRRPPRRRAALWEGAKPSLAAEALSEHGAPPPAACLALLERAQALQDAFDAFDTDGAGAKRRGSCRRRRRRRR